MSRKRTSFMLILLGAILFATPIFIPMALTGPPVFSDSFENNNFNLWTTVYASSGESVSIVATPYHGTYSASFVCNGDASREYAYLEAVLPQNYAELYVALRFQRSAIFENEYVLSLYGSDLLASVLLRNSVGGLRMWYRNDTEASSYSHANYETSPSAGAWHYIEVHAIVSSSGSFSLVLDDTQIITVPTVDSDGVGAITKIRVGSYGTMYEPSYVAHTTLIDTVVVATEPIDGDIPGQSPEPEPETKYDLSINSTPISGITYAANGTTGQTGTALSLNNGTYQVLMPSTVTQGGVTYTFKQWDDGGTNPAKTISLQSDVTLSVTYQEPATPQPDMGILEVHAYYDDDEVDASCEIASEGITFATTTLGATLDLTPKTYTVTATYNGETQTQDATIVDGQTTRIDFQFTSTPTPPPPSPTPTPSIQTNTPLILQVSGIGIAAIGITQLVRKPRVK